MPRPQSEPATCPGKELDAVVERTQALVQRAVERGRALVARDGEVGPAAVADEQRIAGEHEPGLVAARAVGDDDAAVLGAVPGRVEDVERDVADLDAIAVAQRPVLVDGVRDLVDRDPAPLARAPARRGPRRGRRACGSRSRRPAGARGACTARAPRARPAADRRSRPHRRPGTPPGRRRNPRSRHTICSKIIRPAPIHVR